MNVTTFSIVWIDIYGESYACAGQARTYPAFCDHTNSPAIAAIKRIGLRVDARDAAGSYVFIPTSALTVATALQRAADNAAPSAVVPIVGCWDARTVT